MSEDEVKNYGYGRAKAKPMRGRANTTKSKGGMSGNYDPKMDRVPTIAEEELHRARLRIIEIGIQKDASFADMQEVLDMIGEVSSTGALVNRER